MANGRWQNAQVFSIFHLPSAIQDAFFSILLGAPARVSPASAAEHEQHEENDK
jgi:hypothetical protein